MITVDSVTQIITTPRKEYSEGPIFFKRKGIYYYLYTIGGDEKYQYAYVMSKVSPMGPFEYPEQDIVSTTDYEEGVFGPGHGCVFHPDGTDDYYFAYLEFGRRSTNRQTYVNRLEFNEDGTIRPVRLTLNGVGALRKVKQEKKNKDRYYLRIQYRSSSTHQADERPFMPPYRVFRPGFCNRQCQWLPLDGYRPR